MSKEAYEKEEKREWEGGHKNKKISKGPDLRNIFMFNSLQNKSY